MPRTLRGFFGGGGLAGRQAEEAPSTGKQNNPIGGDFGQIGNDIHNKVIKSSILGNNNDSQRQ